MEYIKNYPNLLLLFNKNDQKTQNDILDVLNECIMKEYGYIYGFKSTKHNNRPDNFWLKIHTTQNKDFKRKNEYLFCVSTNNEFTMWRLINMLYDYASEINNVFPDQNEWFHVKEYIDLENVINSINDIIQYKIDHSVITTVDVLNVKYRCRLVQSDCTRDVLNECLQKILKKLIKYSANKISNDNCYIESSKNTANDDTIDNHLKLDPDQTNPVKPNKVYIEYDDDDCTG